MAEFLDDEQVNQLLIQVTKGLFPLRNYCMIYLMLVHGLRTKEVMDLRMQDADLINGWLAIRRSFRGEDDIHPLTVNGQRLLSAWLVTRQGYRHSGPESPLFVMRYGHGWSRQGITRLLSNLSNPLPFSVTSSVLYQTTWESLLSLPARERDIRMYLGRVENRLSFAEKQRLQQAFAFWHQGAEWVLSASLRSQNGPKCLLVWILFGFLQVLSLKKTVKYVSYC